MAFLHSGHQALFNLTDAAIHKFSGLNTTQHISEGFPPVLFHVSRVSHVGF